MTNIKPVFEKPLCTYCKGVYTSMEMLWKAYFQLERMILFSWVKLLTHDYNGYFYSGPQSTILIPLTIPAYHLKKQWTFN